MPLFSTILVFVVALLIAAINAKKRFGVVVSLFVAALASLTALRQSQNDWPGLIAPEFVEAAGQHAIAAILGIFVGIVLFAKREPETELRDADTTKH